MLIVVTGPSGVGKTYLGDLLNRRYPKKFRIVKLFTTRRPRRGEKAVDRTYVSKAEFEKLISQDKLSLYGEFDGNWYGWGTEITKNHPYHLITNVWPSYMRKFLKLEHVLPIILTIRANDKPMLVKRIMTRGQTAAAAQSRLAQEANSLSYLNQFSRKHNIKKFVIEDDTTLEKQVIPWLLQQVE